MEPHLLLDDLDLAALCAIMPRFTAEQLQAILPAEAGQVAAFLGGEQVVADAERGGWYSLRAERAAEVRARMRAERPESEFSLRRQAFEYFRRCLASEAPPLDRDAYEDGCFEQLDALFLRMVALLDWPQLDGILAAARQVGPLRPANQRRLSYYAGYLAIRTQDYERGERVLSQLLAERDIEPGLRLRAMRGLSHAYWFRTLYDRAIELQQQVADLARAAGDESILAMALLDMALCLHEVEQYERALANCLQALAIFERRDDRYRLSNALYHAGLYSMYLGRWSEAIGYCERAGRLNEELGQKNALGYVSWLQGYLAHILGDEAASEAAYCRALAIAAETDDGQPAQVLDAHIHLGFLYQTQGRWEAAAAQYDRALGLALRIGRRHRLCEIAFRRGQVLEQQGRPLDARAAYREAIERIEELKGEFSREDVKISLLGTSQQIYEAMVRLCLALGDDAQAFHFVERARSRAFLDTLAQRSPSLYASLDQPVVTLAELQRHLPAGTLVLEYFTTGVLPRGDFLINQIPQANARLRAHLAQPAQVILFAIRRDRYEVHRLPVDPNRLRPQPHDRYPGRHLVFGRIPQSLYEQLIAPVAALLGKCRELYVIPHGPLHYVPFSALRARAGEYLVRRGGPALAQAPSATILLRGCLARPHAPVGDILAIGYDDPQGDEPLRYAEAEARHVARMSGGGAWTDREPKSERLLDAARGLGWLHIAGHARFDPDDPLGSGLLLGPGDWLSARAIMERLRLDADLVILSSCTSGISHVVPGDELLGFQRAFLYAGALTVICTRWEAVDLVALLVMDRFYRELRRHRPGIALRNAQIAVREMTLRGLRRTVARLQSADAAFARLFDSPHAIERSARAAAADPGASPAEPGMAWRAAAARLANLSENLGLPADAPPDARPFADPQLWAPFLLIGRA